MSEQGRYLILRKIKYGESDLILHALSTSGEKKSFLARAALKSKKRFGGGVLEPLHFCEFSYKKTDRIGQMSVLEEASIIQEFSGLKRDYDLLEFGLKILECAAKVSQEGDAENTRLFQLVGHALSYLEKTNHLPLFKIQFFLKFLLQQGVLSPDPWMVPFLKTSLEKSEELKEHESDLYRLDEIEQQVKYYIAHAE